MIGKYLLAGAATLALATTALAQPGPGPMPQNGPPPMGPGMMPDGHMRDGAMHDGMTMDFVTKASQSDEFERREGRIAQQKASNPMVRDFAGHMVMAHTQTTRGLKMAIRDAGMAPPPPPMLTDDQKHMIHDLMHRNGGDFDRAYMDQQIHAHEQALQLMQGYGMNGHPGPIKDAANKTAPLVQQHLDMAHRLRGQLG